MQVASPLTAPLKGSPEVECQPGRSVGYNRPFQFNYWERFHEAHVPAKQPPQADDARIPRPHAIDRRTQRPQAPPRQGPPPPGLVSINGPSKQRFEEIFAKGRRVSGPLARLTSLPGTGLLGVATAKKIGTKPPRNRAKRRYREAVRTQSGLLDSRFDFVLIVTESGARAPFERIQEEVRRLFAESVKRWADESESS